MLTRFPSLFSGSSLTSSSASSSSVKFSSSSASDSTKSSSSVSSSSSLKFFDYFPAFAWILQSSIVSGIGSPFWIARSLSIAKISSSISFCVWAERFFFFFAGRPLFFPLYASFYSSVIFGLPTGLEIVFLRNFFTTSLFFGRPGFPLFSLTTLIFSLEKSSTFSKKG